MLPGPVAFQRVAGIFNTRTTKYGIHGQAIVGVWIISCIIAGRFPVGQVIRHPRSNLRRIKGRQHGVVPCDEVDALVVTDIHLRRRRDLFHVAHAGGMKRLGLRFGKGRQQQSRQNGDDSNYHQQLDESETFNSFHLPSALNYSSPLPNIRSKHEFSPDWTMI